MCEKQTLIALTGPTAVGKTALSLALAKELDGEIISADSMQVYRGMDIGTAKIQREEMQGIPHHLIDILEPEENFDAMQFQQRAAAAIADIEARGKVPILVGGTGFYLQTVLYEVPFSEESRDEAVHAALAERRAREGIAALYAELTKVDPEAAAQIHPNNEKRVLRALEYYLSSGEKISLHNAAARERRSPYRLFYFVLNTDRAKLYRSIDARVEAMFEAGLLEEVHALAARGVPRTATSMQGIGYHELFPYLDGEAELLSCKEQIKTDTRHFAKRQLTWFRRERDAQWFMREDYASEKAILEDMLRRVRDRREDTE